LSKQIDAEFHQPSEIFRILTSETKLATLHELQTVYGLSDVYDMMELLDLQDAIRIDTQPKGNK
jgi:hypothetical protein